MKLKEWLFIKRISHAAFGSLIDKPQPTVSRYVEGSREPDAAIRQLIVNATNGDVTIEDMHQTRLAWLKQQESEAA